MSYDIFLARLDPSGRTVRSTNPFTGEQINTIAPSPLARDELERLAANLANAHPNFTADRQEDDWVIADPAGPENMPLRLYLGQSSGHFELRSPSDAESSELVLEVVSVQLKALYEHGFQATAPNVDVIEPGQGIGPLLQAYTAWIGYKTEVTDRSSRDE